MPTLRELKNRLQGVKTTGKLAGAMRTVSTAKYSRAAALKRQSAPYSEAAELLYGCAAAEYAGCGKSAQSGRSKKKREDEFDNGAPLPRPAVVIVSGNRGLSGGCDHELFTFFAGVLTEYAQAPLIITCGKKAAEFAKEKRLEVLRDHPLEDVPGFDSVQELAGLLNSLYEEGTVSSVDVCFMHAHNMLKREPVIRRFLPKGGEPLRASAEASVIFVPDAATVTERLAPELRAAELYSWLLDSACAVQSATLVAMRSAYDNASAQAELLETAINRRRQQEVTSSVLETSSGMNV